MRVEKSSNMEGPNSRDMGQMVHSYKKVVKGRGCMTMKGLVKALGLWVRLRFRFENKMLHFYLRILT